MRRKTEIIVFRSFRPFLYILNIVDAKNLRSFKNIGVATAVAVLLSGYVIAIVAATLFCFQHNFDLSEVALTTAMLISAPVMGIAYASTFLQRRKINNVVDQLNRMINARKRLFANFSHTFSHAERIFLVSTGTSR